MSSFTLGLAILGGLVLAAAGGLQRLDLAPQHAAPAASAGDRGRPRQAGRGRRASDPVFDAEPVRRRCPRTGAQARPGRADRRAGADRAGGPGLRRRRAGRHAADAPRRQQALRHRRPQRARRSNGRRRTPGQRYSAFQAGVQLANRTGALNEIEYSEFVMKAQAFADAINGAPEFPGDAATRWRAPASWTSSPAATTPSWASPCARAMPPGARATCSRTRRAWASWPARFPGRMVLPASVAGRAAGAGPVVRHAGGAGRRSGAVGACAS